MDENAYGFSLAVSVSGHVYVQGCQSKAKSEDRG